MIITTIIIIIIVIIIIIIIIIKALTMEILEQLYAAVDVMGLQVI